jgi:hypothetical protein
MAGVAAAVGAATSISSCAATPANIPVRSFEAARNVDYLCIAYNDANGNALQPTANVGLSPDLCTQVPTGVTGSTLANHLLALVTQSTRGEVAVVDLTSNVVVDESHDTPGINFIPVGTAPTGIVVAPDAQMTFVSSADANKPAVYGIPTSARRFGSGGATIAGVLGDSTQQGSPLPAPLQVTDLPACALPQAPETISVVTMPQGQGGPAAGYVLFVSLRGNAGAPARVVTIDPSSLLGGAGIATAPVDGGAGDAGTSAPPVTPGILAPCPILGVTALAGVSQVPSTWTAGPAWPDGVPYAVVGDLSSQLPSGGPACAPEAGAPGAAMSLAGADDSGTGSPQPFPTHAVVRDDAPIVYVGDSEVPVIHVLDVSNPARPVELAPLLATSVAEPTRRVAVGDIAISPVTRQYQRYLYAVDTTDGSVMVYDVTDPIASSHTPLQRPHAELNPLMAPDRVSFSSPVASIAFATHDFPFVPPSPNTNQVNAVTGLLCNPNPNALTEAGAMPPFLDNGAYYRVDQAATTPYANGTAQQFPFRLRGVFGFATLTTGQVVTVDVDDWDAPCRRPDPMVFNDGGLPPQYGVTGLLAVPQEAGVPGSPTFLDPYSAPFTELPPLSTPATTQEAFFPVSAPNRMRSSQLLRNDPTSGNHAPSLLGVPSLSDVTGAPVAVTSGATVASLLLPTTLPPGFVDPSLIIDPTDPPYLQTPPVDASTVPSAGNVLPGVRLSFDDPTVTQDQSWTVTYEGALPTLTTVAADIVAAGDPAHAYETLTFTIGQVAPAADAGLPSPGLGPGFCERGLEDWDIGQQRAGQEVAAATSAGLPTPPDPKQWTADYVEIVDDVLPQGDPYWNIPNSCWNGVVTGTESLASTRPGSSVSDPQSLADARFNACTVAFGPGSNADSHYGRDLPILRAYDDHLDVGRFYWNNSVPEQTTNRLIAGPDPSNKPSLQFVACCFHNQATFKVRAGGEWIAVGQNGVGFLNHVVAANSVENDPLTGTASRRCVLSCDPQDVLLNARSFDVQWAPIPWGRTIATGDAGAAPVGGSDGGSEAGAGGLSCSLPSGAMPQIERTSPLALMNPFFSYVTWMGCGLPTSAFDHTITPRDYTWRYQVGGGFLPLTISLTGNALVTISPQSMRFIQPLGWMAVVDGQSQGLELIDLDSLSIAQQHF